MRAATARPEPRPHRPHDDWSYLDTLQRPRRLHHFLERVADSTPHATALIVGDEALTYARLDDVANRLANLLRSHGVGPGSTVGILIERSTPMYVGIVGALKTGARYVPIDSNAPRDRIEYIVNDAGVDVLLTSRDKSEDSDGLPLRQIFIDDLDTLLHASDPSRPRLRDDDDPVAYVIYTSGSTGRPKGVAIAHSSICNFVVVASEVYHVQPTDRVYQGLSISFDFSLEEFWTTWAVGATLVAGPTDGRVVGSGLADFLTDNRITFLHTVPTVLTTLDRTPPLIRTVNLGGEACPQELVERWGVGRRILNTYGPTECTASCTWSEMTPGVPVTIGFSLPTYHVTLRDEDFRIVPDGEVGELCVSGVGVAVGYVGRDDLTADKFVIDEEGRRTYKTGDLGRFNRDREIEYLGRKDAEVKVRGHRVDLGEIESVVMELPGVSSCVVDKLVSEGTGGELVAYILPAGGVEGTRELASLVHDHCRDRLPPYMVVDYVEFVETVPLMPSGKADRRALPAPTHPRLVASRGRYAPSETQTEGTLVALWSSIPRVPPESLSVNADLFTDLGGHSLIAATLVSRLRSSKVAGTADLSIPDLYANPTIRAVAQHIDISATAMSDHVTADAVRRRYAAPRIWLFGFLQFLYIYLVITFATLPLAVIYWLAEGDPSTSMLLQIVSILPVSYLLFRWLVPLVTCQLLGRGLRAGEYPLYSWTHLRVWTIQRALSMSPLPHLTGSHAIAGYLRLLGARVGEACHIGTAQIPLPSLIELGDNVTVGYETHLRTFEIEDGRLHLGRVTLGDRAIVGPNCVLSGECSMGADTVLQAQSLLRHGDHVPDGQEWAGSPATPQPPARTDPALATMRQCSDAPRHWAPDLRRKLVAGIGFLELMPMLATLPILIVVWWALLTFDHIAALYVTLGSGVIFVVSTCILILWFRRFSMQRTPVGVHHMRSQLGIEKWYSDKLLEASLEYTNSLYGTLYTPHWLRMLGAHVGKDAEIATIANIDPDLLTLKDGTFVADMASIGAASYGNGHIAFRRTVVEDRAFVGNASYIPSGTRLGENSLIGVLSTPPVRGVAPGTSWLGNPPIFLPQREVVDDFDERATFYPPRWKVVVRYAVEFFRVCLPATLLGLSTFYVLMMLSWMASTGWSLPALILVQAALALSGSLLVVLAVALMKWALLGRYKPRVEPLWGNFVRRTEFLTGVYEATAVPVALGLAQGTPMLNPLLRLFGVKIGRRCLIDTTYVTEFDLVRVGDDVTVGTDVSLQTHLFEDRVMKMGYVTIESGASITARDVVLYGATVGEDAHLAQLTLVMKGETVPANTRWAGVPARRDRAALPRATGYDPSASSSGLPVAGAEPVTQPELDLSPLGNPTEEAAEDLTVVPHRGDDPTEDATASGRRITGIDLARSLALLGMMVVHLTSRQDPSGAMALPWRISAGNAAALFALLAGVGIALSTGGVRQPRGRRLVASWASTLTRALLIALVGLTLGSFVTTDVALVILPYYAVLFVLAIPFLRVPAGLLGVLALVVAVAVPVWSHVARQGLPPPASGNVGFASLADDPTQAVLDLLLTGAYPALPWMAYLLAGLAIGRLTLHRSAAVFLTIGGAALALAAAVGSWVALQQQGGLAALGEVAQESMLLDEFTSLLVWGAQGTLPTTSWWWLAVLAPHTTTPFDLLFTLGVAVAVLGGSLMVGFVIPHAVRPLAILGSMPLTLYTAHLIMASVPALPHGWIGFFLQLAVLLVFALLWRAVADRGPLEWVVNAVTKAVREAVTGPQPRRAWV
ncbi:MAG: Pls/PosA family non-ribosomal peptide synthetase [Actinomycetes bacterium]